MSNRRRDGESTLLFFVFFRESFLLKDQTQLNEYLKRNEIEQALTFYQHMKPRTVQLLNTIGQIYAEKKGDYDSAINYYKEAIRMQEAVSIDSS